jgi:FemAB-related protein (PEP-CTERM system-associated)
MSVKADLQEGDRGQWDAFVRSHPDALFFHQHAWLPLVQDVYGCPPYHLAAYEGHQVVGILPLGLHRAIGAGRRLMCVPFSDEGGVCANSTEAEQALLAAAEQLGHEVRANYVEIRQLGRAPGNGLLCDQTRVVLRMQLPGEAGELWGSLSSNMRKKVRRSRRDGLTAHEGGASGVRPFYDIYAHNMRDLGAPMHSRRLFEALFAVFPESCLTVLIKSGDAVVGAAMAVWLKDVLTVLHAHSLRAYHSVFASNLLYWELLERAIERGCTIADFGRSPKDTGIYEFKKSWGMEDHPLNCAVIPVRSTPNLGEKRAGLAYRAFARMWRHVPVPIAKAVGPWVFGRIPV